MTLDAIKAAIPHREPFLLLDQILEQADDRIVCRKTFHGDEFWYQGHYPEFPITPGVLLCEAAMQAGAVLLSTRVGDRSGATPVATRLNNVQFRQTVLPGATIDVEVQLVEQLAEAFFMKARVSSGGKLAARLEFACTLTPRREA
jgi:3-hydroxyacyl-[acyl-carrier-protein] dehydratase